MTPLKHTLILTSVLALAGCTDGIESDIEALNNNIDGDNDTPTVVSTGTTAIDQQLGALLTNQNITGDPTVGLDLPSIDDPLSQLGMKLFYSKSLGGCLLYTSPSPRDS